MEQYYYSPQLGQTYSSYQMRGLFGIATDTTHITIINERGFYPVLATSPEFDGALYTPASAWEIVALPDGGEGAQRAFSPVPRDLADAQARVARRLKEEAGVAVSSVLTVNAVTEGVLASVASQEPVARPSLLQLVLDEATALTDALGANLDTVAAAISVDELAVALNPPSGTITFHRSGSNLIDGLFRDAGAADPDALTLSEGWAPEQFTLRLVTNDITVPYVLPEGFKEVSGGLGTGTQSMELKVGDIVVATFSITTGTADKIFTF